MRPLILAFSSALTAFTARPELARLITAPSFANMLMVRLWLSFLYGSYNGRWWWL
jgi:MHS family citrate/tricarballylate:H+ symporter-like MFS transporter